MKLWPFHKGLFACCHSSLIALAELEGPHGFTALLCIFLGKVDGGLHKLAELLTNASDCGAVMLSNVYRIHRRASLFRDSLQYTQSFTSGC